MKENTDPLDLSTTPFYLPKSENAIVEAFEMAVASFKVSKGIPGSKFYYPPEFEYVPKKTVKETKAEPQKHVTKPQTPTETVQQKPPTPKPKPKLLPEVESKPEPAVYPPPMPLEIDPDQAKLLHAWYWAGYYTAVVYGKQSQPKK